MDSALLLRYRLRAEIVDIHEGIDNTLLILNHRLKAVGNHTAIQVIKEYSSLPLVECYAD